MKIIQLTFLSGLITSASLALGSPRGDKSFHSNKMKKVFSQLNLTKEQENKIKEIHKKEKANHQAAQQKAMSSHVAFENAMKDPKKSEKELENIHETVIEAKVNMMRLRFKGMMETRKVLNDDQRVKFQMLMSKRKGWKKGRKKSARKDLKGSGMSKGTDNDQ